MNGSDEYLNNLIRTRVMLERIFDSIEESTSKKSHTQKRERAWLEQEHRCGHDFAKQILTPIYTKSPRDKLTLYLGGGVANIS